MINNLSLLLLEEKSFVKAIFYVMITIGFLLLLFFTLNRDTSTLWFDEQWYLDNVILLKNYGVSKQFILEVKGPAGPLHAIIHYLFLPLTDLKLPYIRLINISFTLPILFVLYQIHKLLKAKNSIAATLGFYAVPMIYVCTGMALTEIPAMLFAVLSYLFLIYSLETKSPIKSYLFAIVAGTFLSIAILGRQPYLMLCLAVMVYIFPIKTYQKRLPLLITFLVFSLIIPAYVFNIWQNIQPAIESQTGKGFQIFHGILAFAYAFIIILILSPSWISYPKIKHISLTFLIIIAVNGIFLKERFLPMMSTANKYFSEYFTDIFSLLFASTVMLFSILFLYSCLQYFFNNINNKHNLFILLATVFILATSAKITHQFSSRYIVQAAPFIVLLTKSHISFNPLKLLVTLIGISIGIISLNSYF